MTIPSMDLSLVSDWMHSDLFIEERQAERSRSSMWTAVERDTSYRRQASHTLHYFFRTLTAGKLVALTGNIASFIKTETS